MPVLAIETRGAASLALSLNSSYSSEIPEPRLERLPAINTIARSLGASAVSETCLNLSLAHEGGVVSIVVEDERTLVCSRKFVGMFLFVILPYLYPVVLATRAYDPSTACNYRRSFIAT